MPSQVVPKATSKVAVPKTTVPETAAAKPKAPKPSAPAGRDCRVAYWYDPMVPDQHFDKPGKSPFMEMQLVPKFSSGTDPNCTIRDVEASPAQDPQS